MISSLHNKIFEALILISSLSLSIVFSDAKYYEEKVKNYYEGSVFSHSLARKMDVLS